MFVFFSVLGLILFAQQAVKTETLSWCKCNPNTFYNPELRKASECEIIFYDTVVSELMLILKKAMQEKSVNNFAVSSVQSDGSEKIEYIANDAGNQPFNIGEMGTPIPPPTVIWNNTDMQLSEENIHKMDSLSGILVKSMKNGTWNNDLNDKITFQIMECQQNASVTLHIYTNRNYSEEVYGSKAPFIVSVTGVNQAIYIPFSQNSEPDKSSGYKGITSYQAILLYGSYKPVKISKNSDPHSYSVKIETNITPNQLKLNLHCVEFRFEGDQNAIDKIIHLIDHNKINELIVKY